MKSKTFDKEFDDNKVDIIGDLDLFTNLVKTSVAFCTTVHNCAGLCPAKLRQYLLLAY
jgi:succinate dehydrogenase/fumarate reductase-like Fe-S protein